MKRVILVVVAACSGGGKTPARPTTSNAPGVIWETAAEPWHVLHPGYAASIDGDRATFGGSNGWIQQFDLATGKPLRARKLEMGTVTSIANLGDGRLLAIGFSGPDVFTPPAAFVLDANLEPKAITLPVRAISKGSIVWPHALKIGDGVVLTGPGLVLSVYDLKDFAARSTLDNSIGWSKIAGRGEILLAERGNQLRRFDLSTNGQRELGYGITTHLVVAEGAEVYRVARNSKWVAEISRSDKTKTQLPDEIDAVYAYDDKHFITTQKTELRVHELPSGEIKKRFTVGDRQSSGSLAVSGNRGVLTWAGTVRLIDLETGAFTPPQASTRQGAWLAVGNDGVVLAANDPDAWTMANGRVTATERNAATIELVRGDDPRHYVLSSTDKGTTKLEVHTVGDKAVRELLIPAAIGSTYLARDSSLLLVANEPDQKFVMRTRGTTAAFDVLFKINPEADVVAADADGDVVVALGGRAAVTDQSGKLISTLRVPHCETLYQHALLDPSGPRAATYDFKDLALWDRKTGALATTVKTGPIDDLLFIPKRDELVLTFNDRVVLWTPGKGTRTLKWDGVLEPAVSADGKKLALSFHDGRIGVYDLDALIAATPIQADLPAGDAIPATCGDDDPLHVSRGSDDDDPPPPEDEDED